MTKEYSNRQAFFNYAIEDRFEAGIVLFGTEVKSVREGRVNFNDSFCLFEKSELWIRGMFIGQYKLGTANNHLAVHDRKLLLNRKELKKLQTKTKEKGLTIVPLKLYFNEKQIIKIEIALAKGKKDHDKRETIKERDSKREIKTYLVPR